MFCNVADSFAVESADCSADSATELAAYSVGCWELDSTEIDDTEHGAWNR